MLNTTSFYGQPMFKSTNQYIIKLAQTAQLTHAAHFVVHITAQQGRVDPDVAPGVRLHAVPALSSRTGGQQDAFGAVCMERANISGTTSGNSEVCLTAKSQNSLTASTSRLFPTAKAPSSDSLIRLSTQSNFRRLPAQRRGSSERSTRQPAPLSYCTTLTRQRVKPWPCSTQDD